MSAQIGDRTHKRYTERLEISAPGWCDPDVCPRALTRLMATLCHKNVLGDGQCQDSGPGHLYLSNFQNALMPDLCVVSVQIKYSSDCIFRLKTLRKSWLTFTLDRFFNWNACVTRMRLCSGKTALYKCQSSSQIMNHLLTKLSSGVQCPVLLVRAGNLNHQGFISLVKGGAHKHSHQPHRGDQGTDNSRLQPGSIEDWSWGLFHLRTYLWCFINQKKTSQIYVFCFDVLKGCS